VDGGLNVVVAAREDELVEAEGRGINDVEVKKTANLTSSGKGE
jgi:hypothetical protein